MSGNLIVLSAYDEDGKGRLVPAFAPRPMKSKLTAVYIAQMMAPAHAGIAVVARPDADMIEFEHPTVLYRSGRLPRAFETNLMPSD